MRYARRVWIVIATCSLLLGPISVQAEDMRGELESIFSDVLEISLAGSPEAHGNHFKPDNVATSGRIISALTSFVGANVASFPLSSTATGLTFDFSSGIPVPVTTSAGPIFAERATTIGRGKFNFGGNLSYLNLSRIRGVSTDDVNFNFVHQNVGDTSLYGDIPFEYDYITLDMNLDMNAVVAAGYATYGATDRIDVGIAIPIVSVSMKAEPHARMTSYTYASTGSASHFFGGTATDPVLEYDAPAVDASSAGIGDIALRGKANLYRGEMTDLGALLEIRLPTGDEDKFLGTGNAAFKMGMIVSGRFGGINPHLNLAYDVRNSDIDRNELQITLGYDQKVTDNLTMAAEWMGGYEMGAEIDALKFPSATETTPNYDGQANPVTQKIWPTNIPGYDADNVLNASFGVKYTPRPNMLLVANLILPVNNGGMRSDVIPTVGIEVQM